MSEMTVNVNDHRHTVRDFLHENQHDMGNLVRFLPGCIQHDVHILGSNTTLMGVDPLRRGTITSGDRTYAVGITRNPVKNTVIRNLDLVESFINLKVEEDGVTNLLVDNCRIMRATGGNRKQGVFLSGLRGTVSFSRCFFRGNGDWNDVEAHPIYSVNNKNTCEIRVSECFFAEQRDGGQLGSRGGKLQTVTNSVSVNNWNGWTMARFVNPSDDSVQAIVRNSLILNCEWGIIADNVEFLELKDTIMIAQAEARNSHAIHIREGWNNLLSRPDTIGSVAIGFKKLQSEELKVPSIATGIIPPWTRDDTDRVEREWQDTEHAQGVIDNYNHFVYYTPDNEPSEPEDPDPEVADLKRQILSMQGDITALYAEVDRHEKRFRAIKESLE